MDTCSAWTGSLCRIPLQRFALLGILIATMVRAEDRPVSLTALAPMTAVIGQAFRQPLTATGGTGSYSWRLADGSGPLPPGLELDARSGVISGAPSAPGSFSFRVVVTDSGGPPSRDIQTFTIEVPDALVLDWKEPPHATKEGVVGSVFVLNATGHTVDLTVVIVAVNETGKAFALAEQHFLLQPQTESPTIPFGAQNVLPFGRYTIHADAVGEVASENQIYRVRKQTGDEFVIKQQ